MTRSPGPCSDLGGGAEFELIRRMVGENPQMPPEVRVGPGDDAAVLEGGWVVSTDLSVEDVHFRRRWIDDEEIGFRAASAALSDLAAMAVQPIGILVSIAAPRGGAVDVVAVQAGLRASAAAVGATVVGGDLSRSPGPLMIDVVALGRGGWPVRRDGAEPGDHVWVTGALGAAAAAVRCWEAGDEPPDELRAAFARPAPKIDAARCLVEQEIVDALIDVSDGLAGDAGHLAAASGTRIVLDTARVPVHPAARAVFGPETALELALFGGEDYELCFVTDPDRVDADYLLGRHGLKVTRVGEVQEGEGVWLRGEDGVLTPVESGGFDHFSDH